MLLEGSNEIVFKYLHVMPSARAMGTALTVGINSARASENYTYCRDQPGAFSNLFTYYQPI